MRMVLKSLFAVTVGLFASHCRGALVINEVCYDNAAVADETGDTSSDWIELYNRGPEDVNVLNYGVGDSNPYQESSGVRLPDYTLPAGGTLVVFANGDRPEYTAWINAPDLSLIAPNVSWHYRSAFAAPASAWKDSAFDDAAWASGTAPFGYNDAKRDMDCATVLDYGADPDDRYPAAYFRTSFTVINPSVVTGLVVRARIDDGMVVYLNGKEVLRRNMPAGLVSHTTLALSSVPSTQWGSTLLATNGLLRGENVLAVEVHQALAASPDLIMDMTLTGLVCARVPVVHGQFRLSNMGENVHLFNSELTRVQLYAPPGYEIGEDQSYGASPDGNTSNFQVFHRPTPGQSNATYPVRYVENLTSQKPVFSVAPGIYAADQTVALRTPSAGYKIYYTLDGTDPRDSETFVMSGGSVTLHAAVSETNGLAWIRTNPVEIDNQVLAAGWRAPLGGVTRTVALRAIAVDAAEKQCSPETRGSYLIGANFQNRTLPIVSLITNPDNLFGFTSGIYVPGKYYADSPEGYGDNKWGKPYANYFQSNSDQAWERPVFFELFEPAQNRASVELVLGATPYGGSTRVLPQKALQLLARAKEYGSNQIDCALFPQEPATAYKRVLLRNSGDDWYGPGSAGVATMMKDAVFQALAKEMSFAVMAYRPTVVYINGEYWGLHNLRESFDKHYFATRYGLDPDNIDLLKQEEDSSDATKVVITNDGGDVNTDEEYRSLLAWVGAHALSDDANFRQFQTQVDVTNYTDYVIAETFYANTDWPQNNCGFWRAHTNQTAAAGAYGDTRWRWMLSDLDRAGEQGYDFDMFAYLSDDARTAVNQSAFLINELWKNAAYRSYFVSRYERLLNTLFRPERTSRLIAQAANILAPEMETHFRRWGRPYTQEQWRQAVDAALIRFTSERHAVSWGQISAKFGLGGSGVLEVRNAGGDGTGGRFRVDGMDIEETTPGVTNRASWSGTFFQNRPIVLEALPDPGYTFDGWEGRPDTNAVLIVAAADEPQSFVARFLRTDAVVCRVTFAADGGAVTPTNKTVVVGEAYGGLPVPTRAGYTFDGWWTGEGGSGTCVKESSRVGIATNHVLYASWELSVPSGQKTTAGVVFAMALPDAFGSTGRVTVAGLPDGLKYDSSTRTITGVATRSGIYSNVVITAASGLKETVTIIVSALPDWARGAFSGYVASDTGGTVSMNVTALGKITGKLALGGMNFSFSSTSYVQADDDNVFLIDTEAKSGATTLALTLQVRPSSAAEVVTGTVAKALGVASGHLGSADGGPSLVLYRNVWSDADGAAFLSDYVGYYTAVLPCGDSSCGSGYVTMTLDKKGKVKTSGKLADGTSISLSGPLILDEAGDVFAVFYASPVLYKGGSLFGLAGFSESADGVMVVYPLEDGPFLWTSSNPQATETYGAGFSRKAGLVGGWYNKAANLYGYYAGKDLTVGTDAGASTPRIVAGTNVYASVWWDPNGIALAVVTNRLGAMTGLAAPQAGVPVKNADGTYDYAAANNTVGLKIGLNRATGLFKGSFKAWFETGVRPASKAVSFAGVLTPERQDKTDGAEGRGFFLWADKGNYLNGSGKVVTYLFSGSYDLVFLSEPDNR
jgi:uncharacterized repeat protein (TIGR02543 family)